MHEANKNIIEIHIAAVRSRELDSLPIADDIAFENPVSGRQQSAESFRAFLSGFVSAISDARVHRFVCDGDLVVAEWEVDSVFGTIQILEIFRLEGGLIVESRAFFDPRPVLGG